MASAVSQGKQLHLLHSYGAKVKQPPPHPESVPQEVLHHRDPPLLTCVTHTGFAVHSVSTCTGPPGTPVSAWGRAGHSCPLHPADVLPFSPREELQLELLAPEASRAESLPVRRDS